MLRSVALPTGSRPKVTVSPTLNSVSNGSEAVLCLVGDADSAGSGLPLPVLLQPTSASESAIGNARKVRFIYRKLAEVITAEVTAALLLQKITSLIQRGG